MSGVDPEWVLSGWRLMLPAVAFIGVQLAWAIQIGYATPQLRTLGISDALVGVVWLAGPLSGIIVQPVVGVWSDHVRERRPFLVGGVVCTVTGLLLFSNANTLGGGRRDVALGIAITAFWFMDFSINVIQGPIRALMTDVVPPHRLARANSYFAVAAGIGKTLGYTIGGISTSVPLIFGISALLVALFVLVTVALVKDAPGPLVVAEEIPGTRPTLMQLVLEPFKAVFSMPRELSRAFYVQFCAFFAWFATFIYLTHWIGQDVAGGSPDKPVGSNERRTFDYGVRMGNVGLALMAIVSIVIGPVLPMLMKRVGVRTVWVFSLLLMGASMISTLWVTKIWQALIVLSTLAVPLATSFTIPWAIATSTLADNPKRGAYLGAFNMSQSLPEILTSLLGGPIILLGHGRIAASLATGGFVAWIGAALVTFVKVPESLHRSRNQPLECEEAQHGEMLDFSDYSEID